MSNTTVATVAAEKPSTWLGRRLAAARGRGADRGASSLEFLGYMVLGLLLVVAVSVGVLAAVNTKTTQTTTCITTSDTTQAGGCK
ncbi:hypothetical protein [Streptomyces sp. NRRL S-350]|uniref:hypothetical protein n=1 Tax=Streptomyces sp. NRRL S-350 TaxID=1463902 RepID=UPI0004C003FD|nr:hypothetical protein [Streptomyces sp. NRRL S-350]